MARIVIVGGVASDEVVRLSERCREGAHLNGMPYGTRLGGGGANTAVALAAAGHTVSLVAAVGEDEAGAWQLAQLQAAGVDIAAVRRVSGRSTRSILLVDPSGERTIVNLGRVEEPASPRRLLDLAADLIYVRSRARSLAPLLAEAVRRCRVVAHVPPVADGIFPAHVIVASASDLDAPALADPCSMARRVAGRTLDCMVLTRGGQGAEVFGRDGSRAAVPAAPISNVIDTTGAGDAFAAGLCHALVAGRNMAEAVCEATRWGAAKVGQDGSALTRENVASLVTR